MDFVEPLHDFEKRSPSVYGFFYWIYKSFTWLMPVGKQSYMHLDVLIPK